MTPASDTALDPSESGQLSLWANEPSSAPKRRKSTSRKNAPPADPEICGIVGKEILGGSLDPAHWAMALSECNGSRDHAVTCYARLRLAALGEKTHGRKAKQEALEARRRAGFRETSAKPKASPLPFELASPNRQAKASPGNRRRNRLSMFWLLACALGFSGAFAAASRHYHGAVPESIGGFLLAVSLSIGPLLAVAFTTLHFCAPRCRRVIRHVMPATACAAAFASFAYGLLVIKNHGAGGRDERSSARPPAQILPSGGDSSGLDSIAAARDAQGSP